MPRSKPNLHLLKTQSVIVLQDKKDANDDNNDNTNDGISDDDADLPPGPISQVVDLTKPDPMSTSVVVRT